ncbi:hypothetical protein LCGC14_1636670 [marine sediment metagenome]|uniref:Uncharacterized protein n=1 Tax=marine sediment metagenome TaxID=412755 RepID=A0A0F9L0H9_9ZZZZ
MDQHLRQLERAANTGNIEDYNRWVLTLYRQATWDNDRLRLVTKNHFQCRDGKIPENHFVIMQPLQDLGGEVRITFLERRPKAKLITEEETLVDYDINSNLFQQIKNLSFERPRHILPRALYGLEWMVFCPKVKRILNIDILSLSMKHSFREIKVLDTKIIYPRTAQTRQGFTWAFTDVKETI